MALQNSQDEAHKVRGPLPKLLDNAPMGIFQCAADMGLYYVNPAMASMYGYDSPEDMLHTVQDMARDMYVRSGDWDNLLRELQKEGQAVDYEVAQFKKDGSQFWSSQSVHAELDQNGHIKELDGYVLDISARKQLEHALEHQTQILQERVKELNCIYKISKTLQQEASLEETLCKMANIVVQGWQHPEEACCRIELDGQSYVSDNFQEPVQSLCCDIQVNGQLRGQVTVGYIKHRPQKDNGPFLQEEVRLLQAVADNVGGIIKHMLAVQEIVERKESWQKTLAEKDKFFSIIAHDLRSPLSGFLSLTEYMNMSIMELSRTELQNLTMELKNSAEELHELLENLLEWARMQQGAVSYHPEILELRSIVENNMQLMEAMVRNKELQIKNKLKGDSFVFADRRMLESLMRNLLFNAAKFTPRGGLISIESLQKNTMLQICVRDTGRGMDAETLQSLFSLDQKLRRPGTEGEKGSGLGLLLCQEFVNKHGGQIWAESSPDHGSVFNFTLPRAPRT